MTESKFAGVGRWTVFVSILAIALEVIIMITPFTAYFYLVYVPVLSFLAARPATAWLTAFYLPHVGDGGNPFLIVLAYLGPALLGIGLAILLVGAYRVYSAKLLERGVMLFFYYLLARDEERRMTRQHGDSYRQYAESIPMFLRGVAGDRVLAR